MFFGDKRFGFGLDSMQIARESVKKRASISVPTAYNLKTLFEFVTDKPMEIFHHALEDVKATITVLCHAAFWAHWKDYLFNISNQLPTIDLLEVVPVDHDDSGNDGSVSSSSSEEDDDGTSSTIPMGNRWKAAANFTQVSPDPMQ